MKVLVSSSLLIDNLLRGTAAGEQLISLLEYPDVELYITEKLIQDYAKYWEAKSPRLGGHAASGLQELFSRSILYIHSSDFDFATASEISDFGSAVEISIAQREELGAIITESPDRYSQSPVQVLNMDQLLERLALEQGLTLAIPSEENEFQPSLSNAVQDALSALIKTLLNRNILSQFPPLLEGDVDDPPILQLGATDPKSLQYEVKGHENFFRVEGNGQTAFVLVHSADEVESIVSGYPDPITGNSNGPVKITLLLPIDEYTTKVAELQRLREELVDKEVELTTLKNELRVFEAEYRKVVMEPYVHLYELELEIAELEAFFEPEDKQLQERVEETKQKAEQTRQEASGETHTEWEDKGIAEGGTIDRNSPLHKDLKQLLREAAKAFFPDHAENEEDFKRRNAFMAEANEAYSAGDKERLKQLLKQWKDEVALIADAGQSLLAQVLLEIGVLQKKIREVAAELMAQQETPMYTFMFNHALAREQGRDLLAEVVKDIEVNQIKPAQDQLERLQHLKQLTEKLSEQLRQTYEINLVWSQLTNYDLSSDESTKVMNYLQSVLKNIIP